MTQPAKSGADKGERISLFVFIDAFGWELVKYYPFLDDILMVKAPMDTVFGYSSTCIPSILTGKMPREHGHFAFFTRANGDTPFARYKILARIPRAITRRGRVRARMSKILKPLHGITGYFQLYNMPFEHLHLFDYTEKRDLFQPGGINGGMPTIFDYLRINDIPAHIADWHLTETQNLAAARRAIRNRRIQFAFVYLGAMDSILHNEGKFGDGVPRKIRWYGHEIRRLLDIARQHYREVRLFVFSDHGMTDTTECCPLMQRIEALGLTFGRDYLAIYDSTMARFWFNTPGARDRITDALRGEPRGSILTPEQLAQLGCDFPENHYGEAFFLMNPGILLCPSFMGEKPLAAMHGYDPQHPDSTAAFMSNIPDTPRPRRLDNIFALMRNEADAIPPATATDAAKSP